MKDRVFTRRRTLKLAGGVLAGVGTTGVASGSSPVTLNVGYDTIVGRRAVQRLASEVVYDFSFDALTIRAPLDVLSDLRGLAGIRYVERDGTIEALGQTLPWGVDRVDADEAADATQDGAGSTTGEGADVAIIDTGIASTHSDLRANLGNGVGFLAGVRTPLWNDDNGHGTHCAGIAAAADNRRGVVGVAPDATLHAVKVLTAAGTGNTSDVAAGVEWTADQGYDVASLSLGGSDSALLRDACRYAAENGVFLSVAAGNAGPCTDCVSYPAAYEECVAVSATTKNDELASFSSTGPAVDIAAPGKDVTSTYLGGTSRSLSGTSMACPHVSGAAATLMARGATATEARARLADTAEAIGLSSTESGAGLLDVAAALSLDASPPTDGGQQPHTPSGDDQSLLPETGLRPLTGSLF